MHRVGDWRVKWWRIIPDDDDDDDDDDYDAAPCKLTLYNDQSPRSNDCNDNNKLEVIS